MPIDNSTRFPKPLAADLRELSEGMAIVIDGDTAPKAIASGQYLFIKNHSTLATGGYHATAAIASGADITSSNVTADADGIVNGAFSSLFEQIGTVNSKLTWQDITASCTWGADVSVKYCRVNPLMKMLIIYAQIPTGKGNIFGFCSLPSGYKFADNVIETVASSGTQRIQYGVSANGSTATMYTSDGAVSAVGAQVNAILFYV